MAKIGLFGASGAIGESIANALREQEREYRVVGRDRGALERAFAADPLAEVVAWDPKDAASAVAAARGVETLIYLVGVPYDHFELHPILMRNTVNAAIEAGV